MSYSKIQNDIIDYLDTRYDVRSIEDFDLVGGEAVIEVTTFDGMAYTRFNIMPDGDTNVFNYCISAQHINKDWSMEEHDWLDSLPYEPKKEEASDEPFDVVVKNKIKIEKEFKKMAKCDFTKIAQEVNKERFKSWVEDNADDLVEYAEDCFATAYGTYMDENTDDYETMAHEAIDNIIDNLWMGDYICELEEDPEGVIEDVIM